MAHEEQPEQAPVIRLVPSAGAAPPGDGGDQAVTPGEPDRSLEAYRFPPLPLLSGTAVLDGDGTLRAIAHVSVVITSTDGSQRSVPLEPRHGGWWPPREG